MARGLARNGAHVYILGRRLQKFEAVVASAGDLGSGKIVSIECNISSQSSLEAAAS